MRRTAVPRSKRDAQIVAFTLRHVAPYLPRKRYERIAAAFAVAMNREGFNAARFLRACKAGDK